LLSTFDRNHENKIKELQKVPKNDIRRHIPKMFLNAINCGDFPTCLGYLNTLMLPTAKWTYEHVLKTRKRTRVRKMASDSPRLSAYYITSLNTMFPDMTIEFSSCRLVTSNMWEGSQLLIEGVFRCTQLYDVSLQHAGLLISRLYHKKAVQIWECMEEMSLRDSASTSPVNETTVGSENTSVGQPSDEKAEINGRQGAFVEPGAFSGPPSPAQFAGSRQNSGSLGVPSSSRPAGSRQNSGSLGVPGSPSQTTGPVPVAPPDIILNDPLLPPSAIAAEPTEEEDEDQRKGRRKFAKVSTITTTSADERVLMQQVQDVFLKAPLCAKPRSVLTKCSFVFRLDARHMIEEINLIAVEDLTVGPSNKSSEAEQGAAGTGRTNSATATSSVETTAAPSAATTPSVDCDDNNSLYCQSFAACAMEPPLGAPTH
jgi:hypothetical protein